MCMAIFSKDRRLLITKRSANIVFPNAWVLPGGHLEIGETIEEGLVREVVEETGVHIKADQVKKQPFFMFESVSGVAQGLKHVRNGHLIIFFEI
mmetsp:Transcript_17559/g.29637  ORF Transcript_17559/g.29637 Transcript_17559/m.29637 type:complete len:94 (+) Transcript_17559:468-749(+)